MLEILLEILNLESVVCEKCREEFFAFPWGLPICYACSLLEEKEEDKTTSDK